MTLLSLNDITLIKGAFAVLKMCNFEEYLFLGIDRDGEMR